jgi:hypothetical protein
LCFRPFCMIGTPAAIPLDLKHAESLVRLCARLKRNRNRADGPLRKLNRWLAMAGIAAATCLTASTLSATPGQSAR